MKYLAILLCLFGLPALAQVSPNLPTAPTAVTLPIAPTVILPAAGDPGTAYALTINTAGYTTTTVCPSSCTFTDTQLQSALNVCNAAGDIVKIDHLFSQQGTWTVPTCSRSAGKYALIETDTLASLPSDGQRITTSSLAVIPNLVSNNSGVAGLAFANGAKNVIVRGIAITFCTSCGVVNYDEGGIDIGDSAYAGNINNQPTGILLDQIVIHGVPSATATIGLRYGVGMWCGNCALINSSIDEVHGLARYGSDGQDIRTWSATGPFLIDNNYLEADTENFLSGGADTSLPTPDLPNNMNFNHNYVFKPQSWRAFCNQGAACTTSSAVATAGVVATTLSTGAPAIRPTDYAVFASCTNTNFNGTYAVIGTPAPTTTTFSVANGAASGSTSSCTVYFTDPTYNLTGANLTYIPGEYDVKNLFEVKMGKFYRLMGNVFDGIWNAQQAGDAITIGTIDQSGTTTWAESSDFEIGWNIVNRAYGGFISITCTNSQGGNVDQGASTFWVHDNLSYNMAGDSTFMTFLGANAACPLQDVYFNHNTFIPNGSTQLQSSTMKTSAITNAGVTPFLRFAFNNSIVGFESFYGNLQDCTENSISVDCWATNAWYNNIFYDTVSGAGQDGCSSSSASASFAPHAIACPVANLAAVGFTNTGANNFLLTGASIGHATALDGLDVGVSNYSTLLTETSGSISGVWAVSVGSGLAGATLSNGAKIQ